MAHTAPKPHGQRSKGRGLKGKGFLHICGLNRVVPRSCMCRRCGFESVCQTIDLVSRQQLCQLTPSTCTSPAPRRPGARGRRAKNLYGRGQTVQKNNKNIKRTRTAPWGERAIAWPCTCRAPPPYRFPNTIYQTHYRQLTRPAQAASASLNEQRVASLPLLLRAGSRLT